MSQSPSRRRCIILSRVPRDSELAAMPRWRIVEVAEATEAWKAPGHGPRSTACTAALALEAPAFASATAEPPACARAARASAAAPALESGRASMTRLATVESVGSSWRAVGRSEAETFASQSAAATPSSESDDTTKTAALLPSSSLRRRFGGELACM
eukprot:Amastigsp_a683525_5.p4 type:complete len:157 gc:universal Amastigsp_a683525_5:555-1025(+)